MTPGVWGEGSIVWLTSAGINGVGLGGVRAPKVSAAKGQPGMTTITRGVWCAFTAARLERRGFRWMSARELEADEGHWAVSHRHDYGYRNELPDFAVWRAGDEVPVAIVVEGMRRRDDRQKWRLEAWRDAVSAGRYHCVQYDCANEHLAAWVKRSGVKIGFTRPQLRCVVQMPAEKIATLQQPYEPPAEPEPTPDQPQITPVVTPPAAVRAPSPEPAAPTITRPPAEQWQPEPDDPEQHERRKELYRELMGSYDSFEPPAKPKRRWFT